MQTENTNILAFVPFRECICFQASDLVMDVPWYVSRVLCAYSSWNVGLKFLLNLGGRREGNHYFFKYIYIYLLPF